MSTEPVYDLYYWPHIPGRGEFVRLMFEEAGLPYRDVARLPEEEGGGRAAMVAMLGDDTAGLPPFAPPVLCVGALRIAETAMVCRYVAEQGGLLPEGEAARWHADQLMQLIMDFVVEAHDVHHPIANALYYEEQKEEALRCAANFIELRLPKGLGYLERVLKLNTDGKGEVLLGGKLCYADLALYQLTAGLAYAFPNAMAALAPRIPHVLGLRDRVAQRPRIAAYLASARHLPFNENGLFRHYPELDLPGS